MNPKTRTVVDACKLSAVVIAALALVLTSVVVARAAEQETGASETPAARAPSVGDRSSELEGSTDPGSRYVLYYFHGDRRCRTCRTIEANAEDVVKSRFAKELKAGSLSWEVVNYDKPETEHFIKDFGLVSASLVVAEMNGDEPVRFEVLQKAWTLVGDKPGFDQYLLWSIAEYMDPAG